MCLPTLMVTLTCTFCVYLFRFWYCNITPLLLAAWLPARLVTSCFQNVRAPNEIWREEKCSALLCGDKQCGGDKRVCGLASERRANARGLCVLGVAQWMLWLRYCVGRPTDGDPVEWSVRARGILGRNTNKHCYSLNRAILLKYVITSRAQPS